MGLKYLATLLIILIATATSTAQNPDSRITDSVMHIQKTKDSLLAISQHEIARAADSITKAIVARRKFALAAFQSVLKDHPFLKFYNRPVRQTVSLRIKYSSDSIFYYIVALVLYLALMRLFFFKYFSTMFTLFFRATLRQQQLREQLLQAPLPALLMNIFFVVSMATYCAFVAIHLSLPFAAGFWSTLLYAILVIAAIYVVKFIFLNVVGWIFGISSVTDTYIFVVFLINKMMGIFLLPFIALLAFPSRALFPIALTVSYILVGGMLFYRFLISYRPVRSEIKVNRLHFFLYLCAFEIAPLLLIYKVLLTFAERSQ
jgi:hypothetical protein